MAQGVKIVIGTCFVSWLYVHGLWLICLDTLFSSFPLTIFGSFVLFIAYHYVKLPPPDTKLVEELLGHDPWLLEDEGSIQNGDLIRDDAKEKKKESQCMRVIAHRGAGLDAPENSLSAFRKCKERGCTAVEFDVALTADGIPVIFHDRFVDRVTEATGELSSMTYEEVRKLDISTNHAFREWYKGERIPSLEEAVQECLSLGLKMFVDIKDNDTKIVPHILALYGVEMKSKGDESEVSSNQANNPRVWMPPQGTEMHSKAVVTSFHPYIIYLIRRADPHIVCALAWRPFAFSSESYSASASLGLAGVCGSVRRRYPGMLSNLVARIVDEAFGWSLLRAIPYFILGLSGLLVHKDLLSPELLRQWHERGVRIIAWTVNNPTEKHFFTKILKVAYITDTLDAESNHTIPLGLDLAATR